VQVLPEQVLETPPIAGPEVTSHVGPKSISVSTTLEPGATVRGEANPPKLIFPPVARVNPGELPAYNVRVLPGAIPGAEMVVMVVEVPLTNSVWPPAIVRVEVLGATCEVAHWVVVATELVFAAKSMLLLLLEHTAKAAGRASDP
jgi:hypothetical protein